MRKNNFEDENKTVEILKEKKNLIFLLILCVVLFIFSLTMFFSVFI